MTRLTIFLLAWITTLISACTLTVSDNKTFENDWVFGQRYVGGRLVPYGNGDIWIEQATVTTFIPNHPTRPPIVMIPGLGLSGSMYTTTPDGGRKGWAQIFAEAGYPVYVYDLPEYSTSGGFDPNLYDSVLTPLQSNLENFGSIVVTEPICEMQEQAVPSRAPGRLQASAGAETIMVEVCSQPLPTDLTTPSWSIYDQANARAWFGLEDGEVVADTKFPQDRYSTEQFEKSFPYRWNDSAVEGADIAPITGNTETEALVELYNYIGEPFILMVHSAGASNVEPLLDSRPEAVRALIGYEPAFLFDGEAEDFAAKLIDKPYLSVYGDYIQPRGHGSRYQKHLVDLIPAVAANGTTSGAIDLPAMGIAGNSHMLAQDTNSAEIADLIIEWLNLNVD